MLLRTATAALSTLSFLFFGASPTGHADAGTDRGHPSGPTSLRPVHVVEAYPQQRFPGPWSTAS
ncbi:hypothetical protein OG936_20665 [Streptomyces sp. NBC_00846]|uniref:hypothetical protein n=1 Tax=Streptomyces sp. NBC_00846 TaxID=2975849 RepID=UPI00386D831C|nr:hypothetical protein OG936_20665 [Streptomyces sp. NBC_00846]